MSVFERLHSGFKRRKEVPLLEGFQQTIAYDAVPNTIFQPGKNQMDIVDIQFLVEVGKHFSRGGIDICYWIRRYQHPVRLDGRFGNSLMHHLPEQVAVSKE